MRCRKMPPWAHVGRVLGLVCSLVLGALTAGCLQPLPDRAERMTRGYVYYFDGAGGGGVMNWAGGVRQGLLDAGYDGAGELIKWNTGLGVLADQDSSVEYKRGKASEAAASIEQYSREHAGAPVALIGLSAGTAVAVFTLEALPTNCPVDNVVLLGASISDDYDLTRALQRVRNRLYVFTSEHDAVLAFAVTAAGTADRRMGSLSAGLSGFRMPSGGSADTRTQYAKVVNIRWRPEFIAAGDMGRHTDTVKAPFVQEYIAPLIMAGMARRTPESDLPSARKVDNPDYRRWAAFSPGAWVMFEGEQVIDGVRQNLRMRAELISKHEDRLLVERTYVVGENGESRVQQFLVQARIDKADHPLTAPTAKLTEGGAKRLTVGDKTLEVRVRTVRASGEFPEYGRDVSATVAQNESVPGGIVEIRLKSSKNGQPYEARAQVVSYGTR